MPHFSSGIFLQTMTVCPVLESIRVVTGRQRQVTVFAFSCLVTTQCSMTSADGGGIWLRIGAGAGGCGAAVGLCLAAQPSTNKNQNRGKMRHDFFIAMGSRPNSPNITLLGGVTYSIRDAGLRGPCRPT